MKQFLWGVLTAESILAGVYFLRYWRDSQDRLFLYFALAFLAMALNSLGLSIGGVSLEHQPYAYLVRLLAFLLIIAAIVDRNRRQPPTPAENGPTAPRQAGKAHQLIR